MQKNDICAAVDALFDEELAFLAALVRHPSLRGAEQSAQDLMAKALAARGFEVDRWQIDLAQIAHLPGFSPVIGDYTDAVNVVGRLRAPHPKGRSLILNGHIDVVPEGPHDMWDRSPWEPAIEGDWMYGRGVGDMKAGLAANLFALDALRHLGLRPAADVIYQSVVEEECTGNGALACLARGYQADAVLIPEPFAETLVTAQVGVVWFQIRLRGLPTHVAYAGAGSNAIEAAVPLFAALRAMEQRMNAPACRHHAYAGHSHALNLNIGKIEGGDWTSSVPAWCAFDVRMGAFPGQDLAALRQEIETVIAKAAKDHPFLCENPPEVIWNGFMAEGYAFCDDQSPRAAEAFAALERAHHAIHGEDLQKAAITATTDARFFGLYADTPALVYGPKAEAIHGFNERVDLQSLRRVTKATALFIADWCGVEKISP